MVKKPVNLFACVFGIIGAIVMGTGMSLVMTDIGENVGIAHSMTVGIVVGMVGMLMVIVNVPLYKNMLMARRKKYAAEVIAVSDRILRG